MAGNFYYQYGIIEPSRPQNAAPDTSKGPTVYEYIPPKPPGVVTVAAPQYIISQSASAAPASAVQVGMHQSMYTTVPTNGQPATVQYTSTPQAVYCPAPAVAAPGAVPWHGPTRAEVNARNQAIAAANGVYNPRPMIPYKPEDGQQWWCRETDGSYTLRTTTDIMENCKPGRWEYGPAGYPYFIRSSS
ncbi:hypothetical protein AJ80_06722 [Polytolypa hystricis UAMH7299]|uniref:Uncharacterized protein n=1 Tax=Polytolypa hystricis (strain UAMH7299) TaxID=1447883 RepID=A0A2B7XTZ9_POLH7|nr:hypothetical protein AJ80_06722 [Polytolypa hystricis UAMH7299]